MPSILFKNNHDGTFTDVAVAARLRLQRRWARAGRDGLGVADYDCDGRFDIFKTNFVDDTSNLYHNDADGTFTDLSSVPSRATTTITSLGVADLSTTTTMAGPTSSR